MTLPPLDLSDLQLVGLLALVSLPLAAIPFVALKLLDLARSWLSYLREGHFPERVRWSREHGRELKKAVTQIVGYFGSAALLASADHGPERRAVGWSLLICILLLTWGLAVLVRGRNERLIARAHSRAIFGDHRSVPAADPVAHSHVGASGRSTPSES